MDLIAINPLIFQKEWILSSIPPFILFNISAVLSIEYLRSVSEIPATPKATTRAFFVCKVSLLVENGD
jgi:hypothetical protein